MSDNAQIPRVESTSEEPGSQDAPGLTEGIPAASKTEKVPVIYVRERRERTAKAIAQAMMPSRCGQVKRSANPDSSKPMLARKSTVGRKRGAAQKKLQPAKTENPNAGGMEATSSNGCINLNSNLPQENSSQDLEVLQKCSTEPESNSVGIGKPEAKPEFKCSVQLSKIHEEPRPMAEGNIETPSSSDEWMKILRLEVFPKRGAEQLGSSSGNSSEESREPEPVEVDNKPERETEASSGTKRGEDRVIPKIVEAEIKSECKRKRRDPNKLNKPKKTSNDIVDNAASRIEDKFEASWLESNSTTEMIKPKKKRGRKTKNKPQTVPESAKMDEKPGVETENVEKLMTEEITQDATPMTKPKIKKISSSPKKRRKLDVIERTNLQTNFETEITIAKNVVSSGELPKLPKRKIKRIRLPRKRTSKNLQTSEIIPTEDGAQAEIYPETVQKKKPKSGDRSGKRLKKTDPLVKKAPLDNLRDGKTEENVLPKRHLPQHPITNENRYLLLDPRNQPQLVLSNVAYSNRLTKKQKLKLVRSQNPGCQSERLFEKTVPKVDEEKLTTTKVSNVKTGAKRRDRKKQTSKEPQQRVKRTTVLTKAQKKMSGQRSARLLRRMEPVRCPDTIGTNANDSGVLSVLENNRSSIQTSNFESNETSINQGVGRLAILAIPGILVLQTPLVACSNNSSGAIAQPTQFSRPPDSLVAEPRTEQVNRFGCSSFNITDLSNSFVEVVDNQPGMIAKLSEDIEQPSPENEYRGENVTLYAFPRPDDEVHSTTSDAWKSEQYETTRGIPTKASLPGSDRVEKLPTTSESKSDKVEGFEESQRVEFNLESNETQADPIINDVNLSEALDRQDESKSSSHDMYGLDSDIRSLGARRTSGSKQSAQKIMPTIIANKLLPRGSMELGFISCRYPEFSTSQNTNDGIDSNEEIRELTIHNQSAFTSVVNLPHIDTGCAVDNSQPLENLDAEPTSFSHSTQQQDPISIKSAAESNKSAENPEPNFDPLKLWRICPEFEEFYGDEDVANNNNDKLSNLDADVIEKVNNDDIDANVLEHNTTKGVVASKDGSYEMRSQSSSSVASHHPSTSSTTSVIAALTTTNLKNFTIMLNRHKQSGDLNWSVEQSRKYVLRENDPDRSVPDAGTEPGGKAAESTCKSESEFSQADTNMVKRKWTKDESDAGLEETKVKRVKLNRKKWSHERHQDSQDVKVFPIQSSAGGSVGSDKAEGLNRTKDTRFGRKRNYAETIEESEDLREKKSGYSKDDRNLGELEETLQICQTNKIENDADVSSTVCLDTNVDPATATPKCADEEETLVGKLLLLQGKLRGSRSSQDTQDKDDCSRSSSTSSSSSSSSSKSSSSTTSQENSPDPENLNKEQQTEETEINRGPEDEVDDDDVLSLGANSLFTMYNDQATDVFAPISMSPLFEPPRELSYESFQDMTNVGIYFDSNVQECNEAYQAYTEEGSGVCVQRAAVAQESNPCFNPNFDQRLRPLTSFQNCSFTNHGQDIFLGNCFTMLRTGKCTRSRCRFPHYLSVNLKNLENANAQQINEVIGEAIRRGFESFIRHIYPTILNPADYVTRVRLFHKLVEANLMTEELERVTFSLLNENGLSVIEFLKDAATMINDKNEALGIDPFWRIFKYLVPLGSYWTTLRGLLITTTPTISSAETVIDECICTFKDKSHIQDVDSNYVQKLTPEQLAKVNLHLRRRFEYLLMEHNLTQLLPRHENATEAADQRTSQGDAPVYSPQTILSPDDPHSNLQQNSLSDEPEYIGTVKSSGVDASNNTYAPKPIDDLPPPCSAWRKKHFPYHTSMANLISALKLREYEYVLKVLDEYSGANEADLYTKGCYQMLRKTVMTSAQHVKEMIALAVRMGANKFTHKTLSNWGMRLMIELCDSNAWILAYGLFKSLRFYDLTKKLAAFALISVEICLANKRPLKAFNILKQNNMFCTRRDKWKVAESNPKDDEYRVMVISLLLDVLCEEHPDHAYYLFTYILAEQTRIYLPIDLTASVDRLVLCILKGNSKELITEIGRLLMERNFMLQKSTFQSLVNSVFEHDVLLSKRLYCYGTWIGIYSMIELTLPLHVLIQTDWKRAEMYLAMADFVNKLSMDMGPAVDGLGPNHFNIYLIFELEPFKKKPADGTVEIYNNDELKASKQLMKTVLKEDFNPPLKTIIAEQERSMKLQSRSVVNYLKSMNA